MDGGKIIEPIAHIRTDFPTKFGLPRQSGLVPELVGKIVFLPKYRREEALRGLDGFSHLWLLWDFSEADCGKEWQPTVRPPRLGGNKRMGVFATRSPFRPNGIGLSCVKLLSIESSADGKILLVSGADLMDNTPIFDIKPYIPRADCVEGAREGFTAETKGHILSVFVPGDLKALIPEEKRAAVQGILAQDPRPAYNDDPERVFGVEFAGMDIKFTVRGDRLTVCAVDRIKA